uniref:Serpin domain-containing protein n=1 Tax=Oncorhynchus mykiss TaxID=8022 RepID=A0A8K9V9A3_ONCMY
MGVQVYKMRAISCCAIATVLLCVSWAAPLNGDHAVTQKTTTSTMTGAHHNLHHATMESWHKLAPHNADFAFALCRSLSEANTEIKNVFFSPLVIVTSLAMLSLGANGDTHSHLYSALGNGAFTPEQVNEAYEHLNHIGPHLGGHAAGHGQRRGPEGWIQAPGQFPGGCQALLQPVAEINKFIAMKTQDKITDLVKDLDPDTAMVLINYVFFRCRRTLKWDKPFDAKQTPEVNVDMKRTGLHELNQHNFSTVVMLPYKGSKSKMAQVEAFIDKEYLKHVTHKTVLSLDEKGTEAAAVTMIEIMPMSLSDTIILNRPFLLFILEDYQEASLAFMEWMFFF